ncbi:hypothetical protein [Aliagarivorans taiwanensis]|uniref:hypothetical protein n=1 Tax=Aliagarivorans taiwanensis TaxID=561966 RepID=UPI00041CE689|nr:hypothetical protein [Aliagarivorans taiwanensis]
MSDTHSLNELCSKLIGNVCAVRDEAPIARALLSIITPLLSTEQTQAAISAIRAQLDDNAVNDLTMNLRNPQWAREQLPSVNVDPQAHRLAQLKALKSQGLELLDCLNALYEPEQDRFVKAAFAHQLVKSEQVEIDAETLVSGAEEGDSAYVMVWLPVNAAPISDQTTKEEH